MATCISQTPTITESASSLRSLHGVRIALVFAVSLNACSNDSAEQPPESPQPLFPVDFESLWSEARECRFSHDHELLSIRVFVDPSGFDSYTTWSRPYPIGATIVKIEYDDEACTERVGLSVMQKRDPGADPESGDWRWLKLDPEYRAITRSDIPARCVTCHEAHCRTPYGFDMACGANLPF